MSDIQTIGVVGAGTMGHGIAQVAAAAGYQTRLCDIQPAALEKGLAGISKSLDRMVKKEKISEQDKADVLSRISTTSDLADLADCQLVVEAVVELVVVPSVVPSVVSVVAGLGSQAASARTLATVPPEMAVLDLAVSPDGSRLVSGHGDGQAGQAQVVAGEEGQGPGHLRVGVAVAEGPRAGVKKSRM